MKEVYRSFEGKLDCENQSGYIIQKLNDFYEIEFLSVWMDVNDSKVRIRKEFLSESDFGNLEKIGELQMDIENGCGDFGQCWYNGKWYGFDAICKIQEKNQSNEWKRFV